jgi:hypothetical protein
MLSSAYSRTLHILEKVKLAASRVAEFGKSIFALPKRRFRWTDRLLKAAQEPLRESKCENDDNLTGFCTMNPADNQFDLFDALGRNSLHGRVIAK